MGRGSGARGGGDGAREALSVDSATDRTAHQHVGGARGDFGTIGPYVQSAFGTAVMSNAEKKLCRRGVEACSHCPVDMYGVDSTVDVLVLEKGSGEEVLTAVGLSVETIFDRLAARARTGSKSQHHCKGA